jgi:DNA-binding transcriptional LysR family regulator
VLPLALARLRAQLPGLSCEIQVQHTSQIVPALLAQEIDIGFAFNPAHHEGIAQTPCGAGEIVVMGAPGALPAGLAMGLAALGQAPFIMLHDDTSLGYAFNRLCDEAGVELNSSITVQTYHMARGLAECGLGLAIADQFTALAGNPALLDLKRLEPRIGFEIHAMHNMHTAPSIPALKMIEAVGEAAAELNQLLDTRIAGQARRSAGAKAKQPAVRATRSAKRPARIAESASAKPAPRSGGAKARRV